MNPIAILTESIQDGMPELSESFADIVAAIEISADLLEGKYEDNLDDILNDIMNIKNDLYLATKSLP